MIMKKLLVLYLLILWAYAASAQSDEQVIANIFRENLFNGHAYDNLEYLSKEIGNRINGSPQLAAAIEYTRQLMLGYRFDTVYLQPVMVPNWKRGDREIVKIVNSRSLGNTMLHCISFGNSVGTGPEGLTGRIVEFSSLEALQNSEKGQLKGRIAFLNKAMDPGEFNLFKAYEENLGMRRNGASIAAEKGALAVIVRSLSMGIDHYSHTGQMSYSDPDNKIPALAIGNAEADLLGSLLVKEPETELYIETYCETYDDVLSYNVIGEIRGREFPDELIVVGGHIDSWDVGEGAHDDGAGCIQSIEVGRTLKALTIDPRHTVRMVLWVDEENKQSGALEYAKQCADNHVKHIAAIESDAGGYLPLGFYIDTDNDTALKKVGSWMEYFRPYEMFQLVEGYAGVDISPLKDAEILMLGLKTNIQQYGSIFHSEKDVFERVDRRELALGAAAMTSMVYLIDRYAREFTFHDSQKRTFKSEIPPVAGWN
jgi:carboxypeptidase Q